MEMELKLAGRFPEVSRMIEVGGNKYLRKPL